MGWDTVMYAISSDNDNKNKNYTKPTSSITVTYHLNNQALKREKGGEKKRGSLTGILCYIYQLKPTQFGHYYDIGILR